MGLTLVTNKIANNTNIQQLFIYSFNISQKTNNLNKT